MSSDRATSRTLASWGASLVLTVTMLGGASLSPEVPWDSGTRPTSRPAHLEKWAKASAVLGKGKVGEVLHGTFQVP